MALNLRTVYIARVEMSSPTQLESTEELDTMNRKVTLAFQPEVRERIKKVRNAARAIYTKHALKFHGLQVVKADQMDDIRNAVEKADIDLKAIDPKLGATVHFIPLSVDSAARGELYEAVVSAIRGQVYKTLLERLEKLAQKTDVPERSRVALLELCDRMNQWNVLGDPDVEAKIHAFRVQFEHGVIAPVAAELKTAMESSESVGAYVEL